MANFSDDDLHKLADSHDSYENRKKMFFQVSYMAEVKVYHDKIRKYDYRIVNCVRSPAMGLFYFSLFLVSHLFQAFIIAFCMVGYLVVLPVYLISPLYMRIRAGHAIRNALVTMDMVGEEDKSKMDAVNRMLAEGMLHKDKVYRRDGTVAGINDEGYEVEEGEENGGIQT